MEPSARADVIQSFQHEAINLLCFITVGLTLELQYIGIPLKGKMRHMKAAAHLLSYGGDEGGWSGSGNERKGMPCRAGRVSCGAQRQPHCDAKQGSEKKEKEKKH